MGFLEINHLAVLGRPNQITVESVVDFFFPAEDALAEPLEFL